jgi:5'-AMP-activated protein kinase catalytic alpha subunit
VRVPELRRAGGGLGSVRSLENRSAYCGSEVDIWSTGVILYALLTGALPFDDGNLPALFAKIRNVQYVRPGYLSIIAKDLIHRMLQANPLDRITIPEIKNHPWYTDNLPRYFQLMDNSKSEKLMVVDPEIYAEVCKVESRGSTGSSRSSG